MNTSADELVTASMARTRVRVSGPAHAGNSQLGPRQPAAHTHSPPMQLPCPLALHAGLHTLVAQSAPLQGGAQVHVAPPPPPAAVLQLPCPLHGTPATAVAHVAVPHAAPAQPAQHTHARAAASQRPWLLHTSPAAPSGHVALAQDGVPAQLSAHRHAPLLPSHTPWPLQSAGHRRSEQAAPAHPV